MERLAEVPQLLLVASVVGSLVLAGIVARLLAGRRERREESEDPRWRRIRELETDNRLLQRKLDDLSGELESRQTESVQSRDESDQLNALMADKDAQLVELRRELKSAVAKTRELRLELTNRAAETIREHVRAEEAQTELAVMRAGSDAVVSEYSRLQQERERLAGRMSELEQELVSEKDLLARDDRSA